MYEAHGNNVDAWLEQADALMYASGRLQHIHLKERRGLSIARRRDALLASVLLRAFVFECLLKALWLALGNDVVAGGRYRGITGVNNHDLSGMAKRMGLTLSNEEVDTLSRLTHFGQVGRYPVASRLDSDSPRRQWSTMDSRRVAHLATHIKATIRKKRGGV